jgi:hypothetical protein
MNIYYIGGSPCSGKSTVAEILSQKYGLHYFKVDDFLDNYTERGALAGYSICKKIAGMNAEEIWMRDPLLQCREEFEFYKEVFEYVLADLAQVNCKNSIITEGAAYVPELIKKLGVSNNRYISITPTKEFQIFHYKKREFVPHVLEGCADKEKAFCNWMDRDILFAQEVRRQCDKENYVSIVNDGIIKIDGLADRVAIHFGMSN